MEPPGQHIRLETLIEHLAQNTRVIGARDVSISSIAIDSREVMPGALFIAMRGERSDGHRFIASAVTRGAVAVVAEEAIETHGVTTIVVPDSARAASQIADVFYGSPSAAMHVAGVTGTNGKTTTTQMIAAMLREGGVVCGTIGTIGARLGAREWPLANTTPLAPQLHGLLAQMRSLGAHAVAMEVSSHALALERVGEVRFEVGALTNLTRDHLDFHGTFEAYAAAKRKLLDAARACVLNMDDETGERWARELRARKAVTTYAMHAGADIRPKSVEVRTGGSTFTLNGTAFEVRLPGRFNVSNALCALAVARAFGVADSASARGLASLQRVRGRMEHVRGEGVDAIVDYAHTPDALENVLRAARELTAQRVLLVFGCGGDRDRGKRPLMGAAASRLADYAYVTSDNPRTEAPEAIALEITQGMTGARYAVELDRRRAIFSAIAAAQPGDIVVVAGKGHENYQIAGADVLPFDDAQVVREAIASRTAAGA
ncbi:MAG: UDP-N-acetylmuramoyl-L-alanyl-D-glutamate--2,6-diaminopimelate ligase [Candidatus Baltobacteraceae bacterium]